MGKPSPVWCFRITHIENLKHILRYGLCTVKSANANPNFVGIGDPSIIEKRKEIDTPDPPGGSFEDYVPFYFGPRSPMLLQIASGWGGIKRFPQDEIIYLISNITLLQAHNLEFFFCDGHARSFTSKKYIDVKDLDLLDWETIYSTQWRSDETDLRRKEKKQAELLVKHHVPISCIAHIGVYSNFAHNHVQTILTDFNVNIPIKVSPTKLYYDHL